MKSLIFAASHRLESYNRKLAQHSARYLSSKSVDVDFAEYAQFDMPLYNDAIEMPEIGHVFGKRAASVDGIIISAPEYNWSYPGSLKNIIDWTSCIEPNPLKGKTVFLMSATPGLRGGILGMNHLKAPMEALQLYVFNRVFPLGNCHEAFDAQDTLLAKHSDSLHGMLDDYVTFTEKLSNR